MATRATDRRPAGTLTTWLAAGLVAVGLAGGWMLAQIGLAGTSAARASTLDSVREQGLLRCGVTPIGESLTSQDLEGRFVGFYPDICRAIAAAVTGSADSVDFVLVGTSNRFDAIRSPSLDVLVEATTWTLSREAALGLTFTAPYMFDGQAFLVRRSRGFRTVADLRGGSVCVEGKSTSIDNLRSYDAAHGLDLQITGFLTIEAAFAALAAGRCDATSTDFTILASVMRSLAANPEEFTLLPDIISKEPLSAVVRAGDDRWASAVRWTIFALLEAEELGITAANATAQRAEGSAAARRLLGGTPGVGEPLGLDDGWAFRAITASGNYGEIFDRNLGRDSPLKLPRGRNALWTDGGLLWAPPVR